MLVSPTINSIHGRILSITGTDPAAGAEISETVPDRRRWRILGVHFSLVTDATVADRLVHLVIDDGSNTLIQICVVTAHAASITKQYSFSNFGSTQLDPVLCFYLPLPPLLLTAGFRIRTVTDLIEGGDNYSAPQILVEEWIDPSS
jgi:hypothetical protein